MRPSIGCWPKAQTSLGRSSFSRKGPEFLERVGGLAAGLSVKNQQMLSTGMGHIEAVSVEKKLANLGVTHVDDAGAVADIRARPQLTRASEQVFARVVR